MQRVVYGCPHWLLYQRCWILQGTFGLYSCLSERRIGVCACGNSFRACRGLYSSTVVVTQQGTFGLCSCCNAYVGPLDATFAPVNAGVFMDSVVPSVVLALTGREFMVGLSFCRCECRIGVSGRCSGLSRSRVTWTGVHGCHIVASVNAEVEFELGRFFRRSCDATNDISGFIRFSTSLFHLTI